MRPQLAIILLALCCGLPGLAGAADESMCRNGSFPTQEVVFGLAKVIGAPRSYLRSDIPPCPNDSTACRGRAYIVPGNTVITGATNGPFVCVLFPDRTGGSAGYLRQTEIAPRPAAESVPLTAWVGEWRYGDNRIALHADGPRLAAEGDAYWPAASAPHKGRAGGPNVGDMSGTAMPERNFVVFAGDNPADCRVTLTLLPPFLLAADNKNCGGMNVSFTGAYRKR